jgi:SWIB-domain-containing proteins implicated in chromatin remodeling
MPNGLHHKAKKKTSKRKPNPAFMRPVQPDDKLAAIVGSQPLPRSELTKKLWNYIKRHGCQNKKKRTMINADDSLRPVFNGKSQVSMFEMTKLVSKHLREPRKTSRSRGVRRRRKQAAPRSSAFNHKRSAK